MNEHFGWQQGGRTASVYTHLSGKQVDDQILAVFGKKRIDLETNVAVDVVRCLRCGLENVPTAVQCGKCGLPRASYSGSAHWVWLSGSERPVISLALLFVRVWLRMAAPFSATSNTTTPAGIAHLVTAHVDHFAFPCEA